MPFIKVKVSNEISQAQEISLKQRLGEAIELIPGKSEEYLLLEFEDHCSRSRRTSSAKTLPASVRTAFLRLRSISVTPSSSSSFFSCFEREDWEICRLSAASRNVSYSVMASMPGQLIEKAMSGRLQNVYCASPGGGKFMAVLQFKKNVASDEGRQRQAALLAFSAFSELKTVFLVDEDVDCFDMNDVLWAMNTRFLGDVDIITIPGVRTHPLDPSNDPDYSPSIRDHGISCNRKNRRYTGSEDPAFLRGGQAGDLLPGRRYPSIVFRG